MSKVKQTPLHQQQMVLIRLLNERLVEKDAWIKALIEIAAAAREHRRLCLNYHSIVSSPTMADHGKSRVRAELRPQIDKAEKILDNLLRATKEAKYNQYG